MFTSTQSTLKPKPTEIKSVVHPSTFASSPQCDFLIYDLNALLSSTFTHFYVDFKHLQNTYGFSSCAVPLSVITSTSSEVSCWIRDALSSKTSIDAYVSNTTKSICKLRDNSIHAKNSNVASFVSLNYFGEFKYSFDNSGFKSIETGLPVAGGNLFHCHNADGAYCVIAGELSVANRQVIKHSDDFLDQVEHDHAKTGLRSERKYSASNFNDEEIIYERELKKKILKSQLGKNTILIIVPNSVMWHIDIEMAALPNGVILLHSFDKTLELLKKHANEIPEFDALYKKTEEIAKISQPLLNKTKAKLEKKNFIVKEICGFISTKKHVSGIIASGLNSLVAVTQDGKILYTLLPDNPQWYKNYLEKELKECGVSILHYISRSNSLKILSEMGGSVRCQYNTVPLSLFTSNKMPRTDKTEVDDTRASKKSELGK